MSSRRGDNWLAGVEAILRSKTRDLRKLADLAGLDPATMYIGTRMDGADLRGQDLRGIKFTHLDRDKVRVDEKTRLDDDPGAVDDLPRSDALVLFLAPDAADGYRARADRLPFVFTPFLPGQAAEFWKACKRHEGPKLVVMMVDKEGFPPHRYFDGWRDDLNVIVLVGVDARPSALQAALHEGLQFVPAPMIFAPLGADLGARARARLPVLPTPLRDLMGLAVNDWPQLSRVTYFRRQSVFLSARGEGAADRDAGWFQLYARAYRLRLPVEEGERLKPARAEIIPSPSSEILFPRTEVWELQRGNGWPSFDAAVLVKPRIEAAELASDYRPDGGLRVSDHRRYEETVASLLQQKGWRLLREPGVYTGEAQPDFRVSGDHFDVGLDIEVKFAEPGGRVTSASRIAMPISAALGLQVSEAADAGAVMWTLYEHRKLLVNLQDLRWLDPRGRSLWPVVAHQARRFARAMAGRSRAVYFIALIQSAIEARRVELPDLQFFMDHLEAIRFGGADRLAVTVLGFDYERVIFQIGLIGDLRKDEQIQLNFALVVDPDGPLIHSPLRGEAIQRAYGTGRGR